jgi:hypothetical protein
MLNLSLSAMRDLTQVQLRAALKGSVDLLTKQQIIEMETGQTEFVRSVTTTPNQTGDRDTQVTVYENALGQRTRSTRVAWVYFDGTNPSVVKRIVTTELDANLNELSKVIVSHMTPGGQPRFVATEDD